MTVIVAQGTAFASRVGLRGYRDMLPIWGRCSEYGAVAGPQVGADRNSYMRIAPPCPIYDLVMWWGNWSNNGGTGPLLLTPNAITITAALWTTTGTYLGAVTWNGATSLTLQPGSGPVPSDPFMVNHGGPAASPNDLQLRTYVTTGNSANSLPVNVTVNDTFSNSGAGGAQEGYTANAGIDYTQNASPAAFSGSNGHAYGPCLIMATVPDQNRIAPLVLFEGDSITCGVGDTVIDLGWAGRTMRAANIPCVKIARGNEAANQYVLPINQPHRSTMKQGATHAVLLYGTNDGAIGGMTLATLQANVIAIATNNKARGMKQLLCTIPPRTTSTDSFATLANQTAYNAFFASAGPRSLFNTWVRAGCPMVAGAAVTPGTGGQVLAGQAGSPFAATTGAPFGCIDVSAPLQDATAEWAWKSNGSAFTYVGSDGTHPLPVSHAAIATALAATGTAAIFS